VLESRSFFCHGEAKWEYPPMTSGMPEVLNPPGRIAAGTSVNTIAAQPSLQLTLVNFIQEKEQLGAKDRKSRTPTKNIKTKAGHFHCNFDMFQPRAGAGGR
jgi:hypothetical protein